MYKRSRRGTTESGEEARKMSLLRSIVDQESDTTYDAKPTDDDQNSFDVTRGFTERQSDEKRANDKVLPAMKNSGDLRFARSLTTGRKPSSSSNSSSSRLSVSSINLRSSSELNRLPPRQSPYESNHKQRMVTKYRELGQMLFDVMQPQMGDVSLPRQGWMLPVESHHRPKPSVHRKLLLSGYSDEQPSTAKDNCYLRSKQLKEQEAIEIMSEGSRTETPSVEIVSVVDDAEVPGFGQSRKRVTFNPNATINKPYTGSFVQRPTNVVPGCCSTEISQDVSHLFRMNTNSRKVRTGKSNKETELRSGEYDKEQTVNRRCSPRKNRSSSLDNEHRMRSLSRTWSGVSPRRRPKTSSEVTSDGWSTDSAIIRRSRSPRSSRRLLASWSYTPWSDNLDQHILITDHHLRSTNNIEIRRWLEQKNQLLRKQRREEKKLERMIQREKREKERDKSERLLDCQEKTRLWLKERKRENLLKKRLSKQLKATTSESNLNKKKIGASQELERNTRRGRTVDAKADQRLRARSAPSEARENSRGRSPGRDGRARNKERRKKTSSHERKNVKNTKSGTVEMHSESVSNDSFLQSEGRKASERWKAEGGKSLSKSVHPDSTDSEKMHNSRSKGKVVSTQGSKDQFDPQGGEFKETSSYGGDADINEQTLDEENGNEKDYEWKKDESSSESESSDGESASRSLSNKKDRFSSEVNGESDQNEESRVGSRSRRSSSRTSSESDHDDESSNNKHLTNKLRWQKETYSEVDGKFDQKEEPTVRSRSLRYDSQESDAERNGLQSSSITEDVDKKKDLYDINDHNDADTQSDHKRKSLDSTTSRENGGRTQMPSTNSSPKRRSEEQGSVPDSDTSDTPGPVHSKKHGNKFPGSSSHDSDLRRIDSKNSLSSARNEERKSPVSTSSPRAKPNGDWIDSAETRVPEEMSPRHFRPPSGILSSHSEDREDDRCQNENDKDISGRNSSLEEQPGEAKRLGDSFSLEHHAVEENLGNMTFRKSGHKENDEFSNLNAETRDLPSRNSAHSKNGEDHVSFKTETRDLPSRNSAHSKNGEDHVSFKTETRDLPSRNSAHSKNGEDHVSLRAETRDLPSRNSPQSKNGHSKDIEDHISFKSETRDLPSRNSAHSKNGEDHISLKAEMRDRPSKNSADSENGHSKNGEDHISFNGKSETRDLLSRNSTHSKNGDDHSRNSAHSKNGEDHISITGKSETRDLFSRNSTHSKNGEDHISFKSETRDLFSRNSTHSKNGEDHISLKAETRDLLSRNSANSKKGEDNISLKSEARDLTSRNSAHTKKYDEFSPVRANARDLPSRNSVNSKNDENNIPLKADNKDLPSGNSVHSKYSF